MGLLSNVTEIDFDFGVASHEPGKWRTADGRVITLDELEPAHLRNILLMLKRRAIWKAAKHYGRTCWHDYVDERFNEIYEVGRNRNLPVNSIFMDAAHQQRDWYRILQMLKPPRAPAHIPIR